MHLLTLIVLCIHACIFHEMTTVVTNDGGTSSFCSTMPRNGREKSRRRTVVRHEVTVNFGLVPRINTSFSRNIHEVILIDIRAVYT